MNPGKNFLKLYTILFAILLWFALILQFYLALTVVNEFSTAQKTLQFFSYFTVLTNIIMAVSLVIALINTKSKLQLFFTNYSVISGITLNIIIVGILYHLLLRNVWNPQGWHLVADVLLHSASPVLYLVYWFINDKKYKLGITDVGYWFIYPLVYLIYALILGCCTGFYAYYFIDVKQLGFATVLLNSFWILLAFVVIAILFVGFNRLIIRSNKS